MLFRSPNIQKLLEEAEAEAAAQNAKVQQQWQEYDTNSEEYRAAIADILLPKGGVFVKSIYLNLLRCAQTRSCSSRKSSFLSCLGGKVISTSWQILHRLIVLLEWK